MHGQQNVKKLMCSLNLTFTFQKIIKLPFLLTATKYEINTV